MTHYLRGNAECRVPEHHVYVHALSIPVTRDGSRVEHHHRLEMGVARRRRYRRGAPARPVDLDFVTREQFWEWLYGTAIKGTRLWVWAHDASRVFTVLGMWRELDRGHMRLKRPPVRRAAEGSAEAVEANAGPSIITGQSCFLADCIGPAGQSLRFIDVQNYAPAPLTEIADKAGWVLPGEPGDAADDFDRLLYARRCVQVIDSAVGKVCDFVRTNDLGNMQITLGGQALSHYRHRHMDTQIAVGPDEDIRPLERAGYYGARAQVYFRGCVDSPYLEAFPLFGKGNRSVPRLFAEEVTRVDVNQCYPFVMTHNDYPRRLYRHLIGPTVPELLDVLKHAVGVAVVSIASAEQPWPWRNEGKVVWRTGKFETTLCGAELVRALVEGVVTRVGMAQTYLSGPIFRSWGLEVMEMRERATASGDEFTLSLCKRMVNSLHGKFGQRGVGWETVPGVVPADPWGEFHVRSDDGKTLTRWRAVAGLAQRYGTETETASSCPIIAACVTAAAREHVRSIRLAAGPMQCVYEDADSLHILPDGMRRLEAAGWLHPTFPGKCKIEATAISSEYRGPKHYRWGDDEMIPGHAFAGSYDTRGVWHQSEWVGLDSLLSVSWPDAPIQVERESGPINPDSHDRYSNHGWLIYRRT